MAKITLSKQEVAKAIANYVVSFFGYKNGTTFNIDLKIPSNGEYFVEVCPADEVTKTAPNPTPKNVNNLGGNIIPFKRK